jgi:SAM-dependent methyltransferase
LNRAIAKLSGETYGRRRISRGGILSTMNMFRTIRSLCPNKDTVIFEIGPGTGYLGALLGLAGYRYVATDVTQALYLYQSHLFETLFGSDFLEGAHIPRDELDLDRALSDRRIVHMPWWSDYTQFERLPRAGVDLVVSNRALLEMNDLAWRYSMMMMRRLLSRSESGRHFIFEDWGSKEFTPASYGCHQFYENGFCIKHHDSATVVFSLQDRLGDKPFLKLPRPNEFHVY